MIKRNDYRSRFNSYLKYINGDGQTILNLLNVFDDMENEINDLNTEKRDLRQRFEENTEKVASQKYYEKVDELRKQIKAEVLETIKESPEYKRSVASRAAAMVRKEK